VDTDLLYPPAEQQFIAQHIPGAVFAQISSLYGHDGFLLEFGKIGTIISNFLNQHKGQQKTRQG
jgi:homoserine O-acetyltransferase